MTTRLDVDATLDTAAILVCTGSGGVGKTTTAAALALRDAEQGTLDRDAVVAGLEKAGLDAPDALVSSLLAEATDHATRMALEERGRDALAALERPSYELPLLADAADLSGLYELAGLLQEQGIA